MAGSRLVDTIIYFFINTQQAKSQLNSFQQAFNGGISRMRNMVLGFIGIQGLRGYYDSMKAIVEVSDRWHLPVEQVSGFANALSQFGGSADEAVQTVEQLQSLANDLQFHSSGAFRDLGAILNVNLQNKDFDGALKALREAFKSLNNDAKVEVLRMLGTNSIALQRMLEADDETLNSKMAKAEEMTRLTEETADKLRDMDLAIARLRANLIGVAQPIIEALNPVLDVLADIAEWFNGLDENTRKFIIWGTLIVGGAAKVTAGILKTVAAFKLATGGNAVTGGWKMIKTLGTVALIADAANGIAHGLKKATEEGASLQDVLDEMAAHSYSLKIAMEIGGALGNWFANWRNSRADRMAALALEYASDPRTAFGSDKNKQTSGLIRAKRWLENNPNAENYDTVLRNYKIAKAENQWYWMKRGWDIYGKPEWVGKQSPTATNDNRTMTFNIYGVNGADDLQNRLMTIINNNANSTVGWAQ